MGSRITSYNVCYTKLLRHVEGGGSLAVFPSGEVSHLQPAHRGIMDPQWNRNVARIIRKTGADVRNNFV